MHLKKTHRNVLIRFKNFTIYRFMGAVDRSDQMVAYSTFNRRTLKWWKKVFFHVMSLSILNSWIMYKVWCAQNGRRPPLQRIFR